MTLTVNPNMRHSTSFMEMFRSLWRNWPLIWQMSRRDVVGRYRGSIMGLAWSFFNPLLLLTIYTFVFSVVFKARWGGGGESKIDFAIILFVGMIIHNLFAECANSAPKIILSNVNYVKKVVFPLEILPGVVMGATLFHSLVSLAVLVMAEVFIAGFVPWTAIFLPIVVLPLVIATLGVAWFLASLGVYVRDVSQTIGVITTVMMFLAPVFYPISALPPFYQKILMLNPLTFIIEQSRAVLIYGKFPEWGGLVIYFVISLLVAWLGFWWFQRTRKGFADVL